MQNYDTGGIIGNDPLESGNTFFGQFDDLLGSFLFGDPSSSSNIFKEMTGYSSQQREFEQQEYLLEKQQNYSDERSRMQRMIEAGINPLTAAAGIAGSSQSPIAPAVSSNTAGASNAVSAAGGMLSAASEVAQSGSQIEKNRADAALAWANERNVDRLADANILGIAGRFAKDLTDSGISEIDSMGIAFEAISHGISGVGSLLRSDGVVRRIDKQMRQYDDQHAIDNKELDIMQKDLDLKQLQLDKGEYEKQLLDIEIKRQNLAKQRDEYLTAQWQRFNGDPSLGDAARLWDIAQQYGFDSPQYKAAMRIAYDSDYYKSLGGFDADIDTAFERAYNEELGKHAGANEYLEYERTVALVYDTLAESYKALVSNPKTFREAVAKVLNAVASIPSVVGLGVASSHNKKPINQPYHSGVRQY